MLTDIVNQYLFVTLEHKTSSRKSLVYICSIIAKIHCKIFSKFPTINISKLNFWLVICIAVNFIRTTLKAIFSIFRFFCTLRFQIFKYCPIRTNPYLFRLCINPKFEKVTLMTGFVVTFVYNDKKTALNMHFSYNAVIALLANTTKLLLLRKMA